MLQSRLLKPTQAPPEEPTPTELPVPTAGAQNDSPWVSLGFIGIDRMYRDLWDFVGGQDEGCNVGL